MIRETRVLLGFRNVRKDAYYNNWYLPFISLALLHSSWMCRSTLMEYFVLVGENLNNDCMGRLSYMTRLA